MKNNKTLPELFKLLRKTTTRGVLDFNLKYMQIDRNCTTPYKWYSNVKFYEYIYYKGVGTVTKHFYGHGEGDKPETAMKRAIIAANKEKTELFKQDERDKQGKINCGLICKKCFVNLWTRIPHSRLCDSCRDEAIKEGK